MEHWSHSLPLGKALDALRVAILFDQLRAPHLVLGLGRELGIAAVVEIEGDDLGQAIGEILPAVLVKLGIKLISSSESGEADLT